MSAENTPGYVEKFEFELGTEPNNNVYWVCRDGRAAMKCLEGPSTGQYRVPNYGIVDTGYMSYLGTTEGPLPQESQNSKSDYDIAKDYLQICQDTARAILNKRELWGIHIHDIIEYYSAVKSQSDNILSRTVEFHPELESYRLPDISDDDKKAMREIASLALGNALKHVS